MLEPVLWDAAWRSTQAHLHLQNAEEKSSERDGRGSDAGQLLMGAYCTRGVGGLPATTEPQHFPHPLSVWRTKMEHNKVVAFRLRREREGNYIGPIGWNSLYL